MRCDVRQGRSLEDFLPVVREAAKRILAIPAGEDVLPACLFPALLEILDNGQADRPDGPSFLAADQSQATRIRIGLLALQLNHLHATASGKSYLTDDVDSHFITLILGGLIEYLAEDAVLGLA